jgi:hypothetical protein
MRSLQRGLSIVVVLFVAQMLSAQIRIIPQEKLLEAATPTTISSSLRFSSERVDFGTIDEMSGVWQGSVVLSNGGSDTVVVTRLKTTCGCLVADVAKKVLAPNEQSRVLLKYYPRGHAGRVLQRVMLYTTRSDEKPSAILAVGGLVTASEDRSDDYPYQRGVLRLRQERISLTATERQVVRIAVMNGGSTVIRPEADGMFLPSGVRVRFEPSQLKPKEQGDLVVEYVPPSETTAAKSFKIFVKGLNVPPRQSAIDVIFEN